MSGRGNVSAALQDFFDDFADNLNDLRMEYTPSQEKTWCDSIRENIERSTTYRDVFIDVIRSGAAHMQSTHFIPLLLTFLELLLSYCRRPEGTTGYYDISEDNYKLICYELFLYTTAAFIKAKKYAEVRELVDHRYVSASAFRGSSLEGHCYTSFNNFAKSLEQYCAQRGNSRRYSVMADMVHDRAKNKNNRFSEILQADVLLWLNANGTGWFPRCLVFGRGVGKLELFLRAVTLEGYMPLKTMLKIDTPQELMQRIESEPIQRALGQEMFWAADGSNCLNIPELQSSWNSK
jgi:hypothetical protein